MTAEILLAGFGGQGVLFAGKVLAYCALLEGKEITWLPSYGPEMRGGTANCSVCVSDGEIGSPSVVEPDILAVFNQPSYDKFVRAVKPGGKVFADSSLIEENRVRDDVDFHFVPATELAKQNGLKGGANIIMLGKMIKETKMFLMETVKAAFEKVVPQAKKLLLENNLKAIEIGAAI